MKIRFISFYFRLRKKKDDMREKNRSVCIDNA